MKTNNLYAQLSIGQGPAGPVGPQGPKGDKGDKGDTGAMGPQGPQGEKGERGAKGAQGKQGPQGKEGPQGPIGLRGEKGEKGDRGPQGIQGIQGPKGDKGDKGDKGEKGERGEKGEKGDAGGVLPEDKIDYLGVSHNTLRETMDSNVDFVLGEVNRVHYEGQNITALDSLAGQAKNAVVEGQTLVNLIKDNTEDEVLLTEGHKDLKLLYTLKNSTQYTLLMNVVSVNDNNTSDWWCGIMKTGDWGSESKQYVKGINKLLFTTKEESDCYAVRIRGLGTTIKNVMLLEGDYTNVDIPYFTGMTSVKAPVLHTVGKNLFDMNVMETNKSGDGWTYKRTGNLIHFTSDGTKAFQQYNLDITKHLVNKIKLGKTYYFTSDINKNITNDALSVCQLMITNKDGSMLYYQAPRIFTLEKEIEKIHIRIIGHNLNQTGFPSDYTVKNIQLEEGSAATSFEPYKSNILHTPEDLELRGIGDVKDELNLTTGELTQRIGEVALDGSEGVWGLNTLWSSDGTDYCCFYNTKVLKNIKRVLSSDKLVTKNINELRDSKTNLAISEGIRNDIDNIQIFLAKSKLSTVNVDGLKTYLASNPITIQYQLKTESIKTVDLSSNHVYSYKDTTHYSFETKDNSLIPTLSLDVPTKLNALVARQKDTIQELTQENESLKAAQQILLNSQLSFYESLVSTIPALAPTEGQVNIPDFIQDLYRLKNNQK